MDFCKHSKLLQSTGMLFFSTVAFYIAGVLFGANAISQLWETLFWSCLMSSLCVLPAVLLLKNDPQRWIRVLLQHRFNFKLERHVYYGFLGAVFGAWIGAFPILLDWNRPWQVWPFPCSVGGVVGGVIGHVFCVVVNHISCMHNRSLKTLLQT